MDRKEQIREIIASVLEVDVMQVDDACEIGTIDNWDSIRQLMIISSLEMEFGIAYPEEALFEMTSVLRIIDETQKLLGE